MASKFVKLSSRKPAGAVKSERKDKKRDVPERVPFPIDFDCVTKAVMLIDNHRKPVPRLPMPVVDPTFGFETVPESKHSWVYDPAMVAMGRSFLSATKTYTVACNRISFITSGSSVLQVNATTLLSGYEEGAAMLALFDQQRLVHQWAKLDYALNSGQWVGTWGYENVITTVTPTYLIVIRLPISDTYGTLDSFSYKHILKSRTPNRVWGDTSVATVGSGIDGTYRLAHATAPTSSTQYLMLRQRHTIQFRMRA